MHCDNRGMWRATYQKFWWAILCIFRWLFFTNFTTRVNKKNKLINCLSNPCFQNIVLWVPVVFFFLFFFSAIECNIESFRVTCRPMQPESVHEVSDTFSTNLKSDQRKKQRNKKGKEKAIPKCTLNKAKHPT